MSWHSFNLHGFANIRLNSHVHDCEQHREALFVDIRQFVTSLLMVRE